MWGRREWTDETLVAEIRKGNKEALTRLYEGNFPAIKSYILKNNGTYDDVEDILQDAVVAVWQKVARPDFELTAKLSTFLFAIAKNLWLKSLKKSNRTEAMEEHHENQVFTSVSHIQKSDLQIVVQYMDKLGDTCKKLLHLFYFEEQDMKEIAVQLNFANSDTAKAKKYQCFKKLEQMVKEHFVKSDFIG
ncbi:MAG: sigma-70 family RNA polymerase sigma factor [Bacteroidetes bacterium]|nr:sigma-70 family RNA polymerase sigma factor [Bacteroidota bacterium]